MERYAIQRLSIPIPSAFLAALGKDFRLTEAAHSCPLKLNIKAGPYFIASL